MKRTTNYIDTLRQLRSASTGGIHGVLAFFNQQPFQSKILWYVLFSSSLCWSPLCCRSCQSKAAWAGLQKETAENQHWKNWTYVNLHCQFWELWCFFLDKCRNVRISRQSARIHDQLSPSVGALKFWEWVHECKPSSVNQYLQHNIYDNQQVFLSIIVRIGSDLQIIPSSCTNWAISLQLEHNTVSLNPNSVQEGSLEWHRVNTSENSNTTGRNCMGSVKEKPKLTKCYWESWEVRIWSVAHDLIGSGDFFVFREGQPKKKGR